MLSLKGGAMAHVLLVDDEEPLCTSLSFTLKKEGYDVTCAGDGPSALELAREQSPDVILLDVMLPGLDGVEVCRRIRADSDVPILMLSAKDQEIDKVVGLEIGADDYITKPFSTRELLARMKAVMRRYPGEAAQGRGLLETGPVLINLDRHEVQVRGERIDLSPKEFRLLHALVASRGRALSRDELIETVWGNEFMGDLKTLDVHVRWLREKIEEDPSDPKHIQTIRGVGYRFD
jgi:two-component system, OmpR family, response regulator RegX3